MGLGGSGGAARPFPNEKGNMPAYTPSDEDMDSSYGGGAAVEAPPDTGSEAAESVDEENAGAATAIVSNKILSPDGEPLKEGDEIVVRVVKNYGDESEIEYAPKSGAEDTETEEPESVEAGELAALSAEGE